MYGHGRDLPIRNADELELFNQEKRRDARRRRDRERLRREMLHRWWNGIKGMFSSRQS